MPCLCLLWYVPVACCFLALNIASWCCFAMLVFSLSLWSWYLLHFCHAFLNLFLFDLTIAQCSCFVKHLLYIAAIWFVTMLDYKCHRVVNCSFASFLFCLPFANRASVSGDLYIDFNRNPLIFSVAYSVGQVDAWFVLPFRSMHMHCISYLAYHAMYCIMLLVHCTMIDCSSIACVLALGRAGRRVRERGTCWVC